MISVLSDSSEDRIPLPQIPSRLVEKLSSPMPLRWTSHRSKNFGLIARFVVIIFALLGAQAA
jgi:hypothetical protein